MYPNDCECSTCLRMILGKGWYTCGGAGVCGVGILWRCLFVFIFMNGMCDNKYAGKVCWLGVCWMPGIVLCMNGIVWVYVSTCVGNGVICMCGSVYVFATLTFFDSPGAIKWVGGGSWGTELGVSLIYPTFCPPFVYAPWVIFCGSYQFWKLCCCPPFPAYGCGAVVKIAG